ncbi:hypothetical protein PoB_004992100 [Plakobranchus ocellatus]|uniref:Uncharacterized protein n=1 Tax=Plakobranchus ocellatus TaxID=259542 RepID=A0AAV4BWD9_9GAST|nr:hypothetical protein PoB_004992100 [Plakobranchus ocellatus]
MAFDFTVCVGVVDKYRNVTPQDVLNNLLQLKHTFREFCTTLTIAMENRFVSVLRDKCPHFFSCDSLRVNAVAEEGEQRAEGEGQREVSGRQRAEGTGQRIEGRRQRMEGESRGQRSEGGERREKGRRAEGEGGRQRAEGGKSRMEDKGQG